MSLYNLFKNYRDYNIMATAELITYKLGVSFSLRTRKQIDTSKIIPTQTLIDWSKNVNDSQDDFELIDENSLLTEEDLKEKVSINCDSILKKRKACKNCTCGLQELQDNNPPPLFKSACGNCNLGDAFRCADCPYMGKPSFQPGEQVKLINSEFNENKSLLSQIDNIITADKDGIVKINMI